jgi:hypothetical protein
MKKILLGLPTALLCLTILLNLSAFAQQKVSYKEMMKNTAYNFYEVVDSATAYFDINGRGKGSGSKGFERWKNENESKYAPSGDRYNVDHYITAKAYKAILSKNSYKHKGSFDNGWEEQGPWDANTISSHYSPGIGRVQDYWIDPSNTDRIFLVSRGGGFWRTSDGGANWETTSDFLVANGVYSVAVNPQNTQEVLIAVQQGGNAYTHGIYKSINGGTTWEISEFNPTNLGWGGLGDNERIYKLRYHPTVANQIFIGTSKGLYVSDNNLMTAFLSVLEVS